MQRRDFIKNTTMCAVAVSTSGFIHFDGKRYVGDCETTTDILGPYYRPDSPLRNNLLVEGDAGTVVELSGTVKHNDCKTPYPKAKIELWHCSPKGVYDNTSDKFNYRGTAYTSEKGQYYFKTILPVPYDAGDGSIRPAHFHLMITAAGYMPFVTQLYFKGDSYIEKDAFASSPNAQKRILEVQTANDGTKKLSYDISMSPKLAAEPAVIDKLVGVYTDEKNKNIRVEFFKKNNMLWQKNEVYGRRFEYIGNNTFRLPDMPQGMGMAFQFEILSNGAVRVIATVEEDGKKERHTGIKQI